jgi:hypothetical protein
MSWSAQVFVFFVGDEVFDFHKAKIRTVLWWMWLLGWRST